MGLDICFYKTNLMRNSEDIVKVHKADNRKAVRNFSDTFHKNFKRLQNASNVDSYVSDEKYTKAYNKMVKDISKFFSYDFEVKELNNGVHDLEFVDNWYNCNIKKVCALENLYYCKINFVYEFFNNITFVDDGCCWVTKKIAEILVERCNEVIRHKREASALLPTRSGFFFGSTDYDEYYYTDVKKVRKDFKKLLKSWKDNERVYGVFSW